MNYGVVWSENGEPAYAGKLELGPDRLVLEGSVSGSIERTELRLDEIEGVRVGRSTDDRLRGRAVLVLERARGHDVRIAPVGAVGVLHELLDVVNRLRIDGCQAASKSA